MFNNELIRELENILLKDYNVTLPKEDLMDFVFVLIKYFEILSQNK